MGGLLLGVNTLYRLFCFFKLFIIGGKELTTIGHKSALLGLIQQLYVTDGCETPCYSRTDTPRAKKERSRHIASPPQLQLEEGL